MRARGLIAAAVFAAALLPRPAAPPVSFRNVAREAGIDFVLENSATPEKHLIETMPGGVAAFDYNGDGRPDLFFANGAALPSLEKDSAKYYNRLYRNDGGMKFTDVTNEAGLEGAGYSMAAAAADYDGDGRIDLFVAGVNRNFLYHNLGNGKFEDVTAKAGIRSGQWAVAAAWLDYDNDGKLDLFVVNYVKWSPELDRFCGDREAGIRTYCHPKFYEGLPNSLYRNRGDGTFEDVSQKSGIARSIGKGMGVAVADYDGDGFTDIFVTNDKIPNSLFHNRGDGTFEEVALLAGVGLPDHGRPISSMGADFRDYDNDGLPDIIVAALNGETFPLYRNRGKGVFTDATYASGLAPLSTMRGGWSPVFADFDNDGLKDLFVSGSHVNDRIERFESSAYKQPNSLFVNAGNGILRDGGESFRADVAAHRGAAVADFDGDGKLDIAVSALGSPAELWHNTTAAPNHWIALKLVGTKSNRGGIGARVRIGAQYNHMTTAVGYASSSHAAVRFGLGAAAAADTIEIRWPSGIVQVLRNVKADQVVTVTERP